MGTGALRHNVTLTDPGLVPLPDTWWCAIEGFGSAVMDGQAAYTMRGRYRPDITLETVVEFEGRTFHVQAINDVDERHVSMVLSVVEVRGRK